MTDEERKKIDNLITDILDQNKNQLNLFSKKVLNSIFNLLIFSKLLMNSLANRI